MTSLPLMRIKLIVLATNIIEIVHVGLTGQTYFHYPNSRAPFSAFQDCSKIAGTNCGIGGTDVTTSSNKFRKQ